VRRSQIPHDVFFDEDESEAEVAAEKPKRQPRSIRTVSRPREPADGAEEQIAEPPAPAAQAPVEAPAEAEAPVERQAPPPRRPKKRQTSVYLSRESARWLDTIRLELNYEYGYRVTKSALVDFAVKQLADKFEDLLQAVDAGDLKGEQPGEDGEG